MANGSPTSKVLTAVAGMLRQLAAAVEALAAGQVGEAANLVPGASSAHCASEQQPSPGVASSTPVHGQGAPEQAASSAAAAGEPGPGQQFTEPLVCFTDLNMLNRSGCFHLAIGCSGLRKAKSKIHHATLDCARGFGLRECTLCKKEH